MTAPAVLPDLVDPIAGQRTTPRVRRNHRRLALARPLRRLVGPALLLVVWFTVSGLRLVSPSDLAAPRDVWDQGWVLWRNGQLVHNLGVSLGRALWGLGLGVVAGLSLAVMAGAMRFLDDLVDSSMNLLRTVPIIALLPLLIVWVGIGESARVLLVATGVAFPIYINTYGAIRGVDAKLVEAARVFGVSRLGLIRKVIIPGALPGFLIGLRWAIGTAWLLLVFAEQVNTSSGLGQLLIQAQSFNQIDRMLFIIVLYGAIGLVGDGLVRVLEARLLAWRRGFVAP